MKPETNLLSTSHLILGVFISTIIAILFIYLKFFYKKTSSSSQDLKCLDEQSIELPNGYRIGPLPSDRKLSEKKYFDKVKTVYEAFQHGLETYKDRPLFGEIQNGAYTWITYEQAYNVCHKFGAAMMFKGLKSGDPSSIVGLYSKNCLAWNVVAEACSMFSFVLVPMSETLAAESYSQIICTTKMKVLITENWNKCSNLLDNLTSPCSLQYVVVIRNDDNIRSLVSKYSKYVSRKTKAASHYQIKFPNHNVCTFEAMLKLGNLTITDVVPPTPTSTCMILYEKKDMASVGVRGVVLTHEAIMDNVLALFLSDFQQKLLPNRDDVYLSFLPAAHVYERVNQIVMMLVGGRIGFGSGDSKKLLDDIALLKPTFFATVPRVLNRIYIKAHSDHLILHYKKDWFEYAVKKKLELLKKGVIRNDSIWDLLFSSIKRMMGGRVRVVISAGAPLTDQVLNFVRATFGCHVYEGYGVTELGGAVAITMPYESQCGVVGAPLPNCLIKLVYRADMGYPAADGIGEIYIKSTSRFKEYYLKPVLTKEVFDADGFFKTGDVGRWMPNGSLRIVDRCKALFKLSQAVDMNPDYIENIYLPSPYISQIFVEGISTENYPVAVVVPDLIYARWKSFENKTAMGDDINKQLMMSEIMSDMKERDAEAELKKFELVRDVHLYLHEFSASDGLLTGTNDLHRINLRRFFRAEINQLYQKSKRQNY